MAKSMAEYMRELAAQMEADEKADRDAEAAATLEQLQGAALSEDDRAMLAWLKDFRAKLEAKPDDDSDDADDEGGEHGGEAAKPKKKAKPPAADDEEQPTRTRPGRKSGQAYSWWVDEAGKVYNLDTARIWDQPDEDDEVPLPDDEAASA